MKKGIIGLAGSMVIMGSYLLHPVVVLAEQIKLNQTLVVKSEKSMSTENEVASTSMLTGFSSDEEDVTSESGIEVEHVSKEKRSTELGNQSVTKTKSIENVETSATRSSEEVVGIAVSQVDESIFDWIPDENFRNIILAYLRKTDSPETVTKEDLARVDRVNMSSLPKGTQVDLTGLDLLTGVTSIFMSKIDAVKIPDFTLTNPYSVFVSLPILKHLTLDGTIENLHIGNYDNYLPAVDLVNVGEIINPWTIEMLAVYSGDLLDFSSLNLSENLLNNAEICFFSKPNNSDEYILLDALVVYEGQETDVKYDATGVKDVFGNSLFSSSSVSSLPKLVMEMEDLTYQNLLEGEDYTYTETGILFKEITSNAKRIFTVNNVPNSIPISLFSNNKNVPNVKYYVYLSIPIVRKNIGQDVTLRYVNEENKEIHPSKILSGYIGDSYDTSSELPEIAGYYLDEAQLPSNAVGVFADESQTVTYIYKKDQTSVIAKDSTIYQSTDWQAEDNFVSATDKVGTAVPLANVTVTGSVDSDTIGSYQVTYINAGKEAVATITVVANKETLVVRDVTIYEGDNWKQEDNFVSATDSAGKQVDFSEVTIVENNVDSTKEGTYVVRFSYGSKEALGKVTVLANQTSVIAKDSTIYQGTDWQAEDNFVSATDKVGTAVPLANVTVTGSVDSDTIGSYQVTYINAGKEAVATITVVANKETLVVRDVTIYEGDNWKQEDNFVSATDKAGMTVEFTSVMVEEAVDTNKVGVYHVIFTYGGQREEAKVTVLKDQSYVMLKDIEIYIGENWKQADNFVRAANKAGEILKFSDFVVTDNVDITQAGEYTVTFMLEQNKRRLLMSTFNASNAGIFSAKVTVKEREVIPTPESPEILDKELPNTGDKDKPTTPMPTIPKTNDTNKILPQTGTRSEDYLKIIGGLLASFTLLGFVYKKFQKRSA